MKPRIGLLTTIALAAGLHYGAAQVAFAPAVTNGVGNNPAVSAVTDVNGDGKIDLICGNAGDSPYNNGTLSILTNIGSGSFAPAATISIGHGPDGIAVADVNRDGRIDLTTANWDNGSGNTLSVWTNRGGGDFGSNATVNVGNGPAAVIVADVNGDGRLDLISANYGDNTLTILTNNGSGAFGSNATNNVGSAPIDLIAVDANGDGRPDVISVNFGNSTLTVLTNNGTGGLGSNATVNVGSSPFSVAAVDANGDGKPDLISANFGNNTLTVLTNNGSGAFGSNATLNVGNGPSSVAATDVNGDGKVDLVCANMNVNTLSVLTNNGSGGFALAATLGTGDPDGHVGNLPRSLLAVDVSGDGKPDLTCVNGGANTMAVLINATVFPSAGAAPPLTINRPGNAIRVSWPSASPGWSLQQNPDLPTSHWGPSGYSGYAIADNGTNKGLTIPFPPGSLFFRLLHP